jgi:hypothetical protein
MILYDFMTGRSSFYWDSFGEFSLQLLGYFPVAEFDSLEKENYTKFPFSS